MPSKYYDIDAILAEEELVPCSTLFDFTYLSHLDPDLSEKEHYLPESSRIKMPLWAVEKWATLGFVRLSLPRHYGRKARERLEADPSEADLRKRNERFFMAGRMLVDLIESSSKKVAESISKGRSRNARRNTEIAALEQVRHEATGLQKALLTAYTGERLRQTMDWALSSVGDDVTAYTNRLSEMERRLFACGSSAASNHFRWKSHGNRRLLLRSNNASTTTASTSSAKAPSENGAGGRSVTPDNDGGPGNHRDKRQRTKN